MNNFLAFFQNLFVNIGNLFRGIVKPTSPPIENIEPDTINVEGLPKLDSNLRVLK